MAGALGCSMGQQVVNEVTHNTNYLLELLSQCSCLVAGGVLKAFKGFSQALKCL